MVLRAPLGIASLICSLGFLADSYQRTRLLDAWYWGPLGTSPKWQPAAFTSASTAVVDLFGHMIQQDIPRMTSLAKTGGKVGLLAPHRVSTSDPNFTGVQFMKWRGMVNTGCIPF